MAMTCTLLIHGQDSKSPISAPSMSTFSKSMESIPVSSIAVSIVMARTRWGAVLDYFESALGMGVGCAERNFSILPAEGGLDGSDHFVGSCISDQGGKIRRLGLNRNNSRRRVLEGKRNSSDADVRASVHDGVRVKIRDPGIIGFGSKD
jgi:hypothetical protein